MAFVAVALLLIPFALFALLRFGFSRGGVGFAGAGIGEALLLLLLSAVCWAGALVIGGVAVIAEWRRHDQLMWTGTTATFLVTVFVVSLAVAWVGRLFFSAKR
jgi:hypothetical protein